VQILLNSDSDEPEEIEPITQTPSISQLKEKFDVRIAIENDVRLLAPSPTTDDFNEAINIQETTSVSNLSDMSQKIVEEPEIISMNEIDDFNEAINIQETTSVSNLSDMSQKIVEEPRVHNETDSEDPIKSLMENILEKLIYDNLSI
jgi:hypothetical protein